MSYLMDNTGGRIDLVENSEIRIINEIGKVSDEIYSVKTSRSDRKGHVLIEKDNVTLKVHYKRVVPKESHGKAVCVESGGHYFVMCPECQTKTEIDPSADQYSCNIHGTKSILWTSVKPTTSKQKTIKPKALSPKVSKQKEKKKMKQSTVDLEQLAKLQDCELYSLKNVKFDHARVEVTAHTLLFTGDNPRKLCFNTYNGNLGKKSAELPITDFLADKQDGNKRWYPVKDIVKTRELLEKSGYERR